MPGTASSWIGTNYLIPVDAALETDTDVLDETFALDRVLFAVKPAKQLRLVILDACRDNPFAKKMKRTVGSRAIGRGLAKVEPSSPNTMIAFAAKAGSTASDAGLRKMIDRGYRVTPQVGAMGYKIDLVVEGTGDRRLAVECDGDQYHGPERWADDMARQRVLERVGWRFWRCWASSFTIDPDGCMAELFTVLDANGIHPTREDSRPERYTEQRVAEARPADRAGETDAHEPASREKPDTGIKVGDSIVVRFLDDNKATSFVLSRDRHDPVNGLVGAETPFGKQLLGFNEEDEIEVETDGRSRRVLIVRAARERVSLH